MFPPTSSDDLPLHRSVSRLSPTLSSPQLVLFFYHTLVFAPPPLPLFLLPLPCHDFPNCMFCVLAVLAETHFEHLAGAT